MKLTLELPVRIALIEMDGVRVADNDAGHIELVACAQRYHDDCTHDRGTDHAPGSPGAVDGVQHARSLFRALGIDPTKRRPSSEALLIRALKSKPMPNINTLVDVGNWCSLDFLLPLGLYDRARIEGAVTLRLGGPGDAYPAIGDKTMNLDGRYLLADDRGAFGSPITDSRRTSVTTDATAAAVMIYAPIDYDEALLDTHAKTMATRIAAVCGGELVRLETMAGTE